MLRTCIAVVDASRARLFTFDRSVEPDGTHEELSERLDLVNPARRLRASQLFTESRPPRARTGNLEYTIDDHRDAHVDELDADFARLINNEIDELVRSAQPQRLIVCASPRMLGSLRDTRRNRGTANALSIDEVDRDLVKLTPAKLRDQLASYGLLPPRPQRA